MTYKPSPLTLGLIRDMAWNVTAARLAPDRMRPLLFAWHVTWRCNFRCTYCNLVRKGWTDGSQGELPTEDALRLLALVRRETPNLYLTGGEPLVRDDLPQILSEARRLGFRTISMVSNMSLLHRHPEVLDSLTHLVVSLDMLDEEAYGAVIGAGPRAVRQVRENIVACAALQGEKGFRMAANFVATPQTVPHAPRVLDFCRRHGIRFTLGPQVDDVGRVDPVLARDPAWRDLLDGLLAQKDGDPLLLDSPLYLRTIRDQLPFRCHPEVAPRLDPRGALVWPCRPLGGVRVDLLEAGSWAEARRRGRTAFGPIPACQGRCYMNCILAPSQAVTHPLSSAWAHVRRALIPLRPALPGPAEAPC